MREIIDPQAALLRLLIAALIGVAAGMGRARVATKDGARPLAGVWTATMAAMLGATLALLTGNVGRATAAGFVVIALATGAVPRRSDASASGTIAAIVTLLAYWAGAYAGRGAWSTAVAVTMSFAVLVAAAPRLEPRLRALAPGDLHAALTFAVIATIAMYVLPDANIGPWRFFNPRRLWGLVVLVFTISFVAFVVMRLWERAHGMYVGAAVGGLVSSTAVMVALANQSRASNHGLPLAIGASLSSLFMIVRVGVLAQIVGGAVLWPLAPFLGATLAGGVVAAAVLMRTVRPTAAAAPTVDSPFQWQWAVRFAVFFALVKLGVEAALRNFGAGGMLWAPALAGLVDVDAITLTMAGIAGKTIAPGVAATAISIAVLANTAAKVGCAMILGERSFRHGVGTVLGAAFLGGAVVLVLRM